MFPFASTILQAPATLLSYCLICCQVAISIAWLKEQKLRRFSLFVQQVSDPVSQAASPRHPMLGSNDWHSLG